MISKTINNQSNPYTVQNKQSVAFKGKEGMATKLMKSALVGGVCEMAANNPVLCQSAFSLGINCAARPATNYLVTPDKTDAGMASAHSIASGVVGFVWPLVMITPLVSAIELVIKKKPTKFLKPETLKNFYPSVAIREVEKNGKVVKEVVTNSKGEFVNKAGKAICRELEPIKLKDGDLGGRIKKLEAAINNPKNASKVERLIAEKAELETRHQAFLLEKAKFEAEHPELLIDPNSGVARSRTVFKTKGGKYQLDSQGNKIGCVVQKDQTPITEELERSLNKENNTEQLMKWAPDILLAVPRSMLTVMCIPWIMKNVFNMEKKPKGANPKENGGAPAVNPVKNTPANKMAAAFNLNKGSAPSFKGRPSNFAELAIRTAKGNKSIIDKYNYFIEEVLAKKVVAPIVNSKTMQKIANKSVDIENMTDHMATAGSVVTTSTYALSTLNNEKMEKKPRRTLALNQVMVTLLSTIGGYTINNSIANYTKNMSYKFSDANQHLPVSKLNKRVAGFKIAQKLLTFSLMYRYVAPVLVTPMASKIGKAINSDVKPEKTKKTA